MRRIGIIIALQAYALLLAAMQWTFGVRTDEAKYLMDIPYPHPPFVRGMFELSDGFGWQEIAARILCATLLVHAAWLVIGMSRALSPWRRSSLACAWLLSLPVILQAGTVMMAPLTALQSLVFLWIVLRDRAPDRSGALLMGLLWLASLLTAYQAVLFAPLVWVALSRADLRRSARLFFWAAPVFILALYTLSNPLSAASMFIQAGKDGADPWSMRIFEGVRLWVIAGSGVLSILGTVGLILSKRWMLLASFGLTMLYVLLARFDYYAVLYLPYFIAGTALLMRRFSSIPSVLPGLGVACASVAWLIVHPFLLTPGPAREVMRMLQAESRSGTVLIHGSFGHEWQYESPFVIERFRENAVDRASAVICLSPCESMQRRDGWESSIINDVYIHRKKEQS